MIVQSYLSFDGQAEEAIEFYRRALGAEVKMMMRFKDAPQPPPGQATPGVENKIMHAELKIGDSVVLASDGRCLGKPNFQGFCLSITAANEAESKRLFAALEDGGKVQMPLSKTFFSPSFGMVADRFGLTWMVYVPGSQA
jgi:PhnB protein